MADKRKRTPGYDPLPALREQLARVTGERDEARADVTDLKKGLWAILRTPDVGSEELAVGLALVASIVEGWPHAYTPRIRRLAELAQVEEAVVQVALDAFQESGALSAGGDS